MTNLSDLLNDFAEDIKKILDNESGEVETWEDQKQNTIEDLLKIIKDRLIGD